VKALQEMVAGIETEKMRNPNFEIRNKFEYPMCQWLKQKNPNECQRQKGGGEFYLVLRSGELGNVILN